MAPPQSRLPWPVGAIALVCKGMAARNWKRTAILVWVSFICYLRPSEALHIRMRDITPPVGGGGSGLAKGTILLHPYERSIPSKTGVFEDCIELDLAEHQFLEPSLRGLKTTLGADERTDNIGLPEYERRFKVAAADEGIASLQDVPYTLRQSGPSADRPSQKRSMAGVKKRGRWMSDASVTPHKKSGRILQRMATLKRATQLRCGRAESGITSILRGVWV